MVMNQEVTAPQEPVTCPATVTQEPVAEEEEYTKQVDNGKCPVTVPQEPVTEAAEFTEQVDIEKCQVTVPQEPVTEAEEFTEQVVSGECPVTVPQELVTEAEEFTEQINTEECPVIVPQEPVTEAQEHNKQDDSGKWPEIEMTELETEMPELETEIPELEMEIPELEIEVQESIPNPVDETQEPPTVVPELETGTQDSIPNPVDETQEPPTVVPALVTEKQEFIGEIQAPLTVVSELVAEEQGFIPDRARGLFTVVSELVSEEQESIPGTMDETQEAPIVVQQPATTVHQQNIPAETTSIQGPHTMASLLQENEFLKSEIEAYKAELAMAREAFEKELNLHTLAQVASMQNRETCIEYMCKECGTVYQNAGYKVVEISLPETIMTEGTQEECPTAPQEPVGPPVMQEEEEEIEQEISHPLGIDAAIPAEETLPEHMTIDSDIPAEETLPEHMIIDSDIPAEETSPEHTTTETAVSAEETLPQHTTGASIPTEEIMPQCISSEAAIQTEGIVPKPTTSVKKTQTRLWDPLEQFNRWKKEHAEKQDIVLQQHKLQWQNFVYTNWENLEQLLQEHREYKKEARQSKERIALMFSLVRKLMVTRKPSVNYALFLAERLAYFQIKSLAHGRPHEVLTSEKFVETFKEAPESDQHLLCELYLHNEAMPEERRINLIPIAGDIQIRAFSSFLSNQLTWQTAFNTSSHNEENKILWIRPEPASLAMFIAQYYEFLQKPGMSEHIEQLQASILFKCQEHIQMKGPAALKANDLFWQHSDKERQDYHPFNPLNFHAALYRVPKYIDCIQHCGVNWIGYHFRFPSLWLPSEKYQNHYLLTDEEEASAWQQLQNNSGFRAPTDATFSSYCLSNLHCQSQYSDSDSDEGVA